MPTTLSVLGLPIGQPSPTVQKQFQMTLYLSDGITPAANKSGLHWAWWNTIAASRTQAPDASGSGVSTDGAGLFVANAPNWAGTSDDTGYGFISDQDDNPDAAEVGYLGTFRVV